MPETEDDIDYERDLRPFQEVKIQYDGLTDTDEAYFNIMDNKFAPLGTFTKDHDWRDNLKEGDNIDAVDNEMDWYRSTVLKVREGVDDAGNPVKQIHLGFRYFHEDGNKHDEQKGLKFFGWSSKYDEWKDAYDVRIQKFNSVCYEYTRVDNKQYCRKHKMDDRGDILCQNGKPYYFAAPRKTNYNKSNTVVDAMNQFGRNGGFEKILQHAIDVSEGRVQGTLKLFNAITLFLKSTLPLWHRQFVSYYALNFNEALMKALCYVNEEVEFAKGKPDPNAVLGPFQQ